MPTRDSYPQGTPNWVDLQTTDQAAAKDFYSGVFGWSYDDQPMDASAVYSIAKIGPAGGTVAMEPFDVMDAGRMAFVLDPSGAPVALWQAGQHIGSTLVNEPGTVIWNELITDNPAAVTFYEQVLGVTTATVEMDGNKYTMFQVGGKEVGGTTPPQMEGVPNHWHVYFAVADADASAAKITELGGSVMVPPFDTPIGKMAVVTDPQGAVFSLFQAATPA